MRESIDEAREQLREQGLVVLPQVLAFMCHDFCYQASEQGVGELLSSSPISPSFSVVLVISHKAITEKKFALDFRAKYVPEESLDEKTSV